MHVIETERLTLRKLGPHDAPFILRLLNDPSFIQFIGDRHVRTLEHAREYITKGPVASYERHGFGLYLVERKDGGVPAGICGLLKREQLPDVDIGFAFVPECRGCGYAFEAAAAVLKYGRDAHGLTRVVALLSSGNTRSRHLLDRLGMVVERTVRLSEDGPELLLMACRPTSERPEATAPSG